MNRRNVLIGLDGLIAGGGALVGTGTFDAVEGERSVTVETAGDADAFLGIEPFEGSPNSDYVDASGDTVVIDITGTDAVRAGVNENDTVDASNSNTDTDLYIDPRDTANTVGEDLYDGSGSARCSMIATRRWRPCLIEATASATTMSGSTRTYRCTSSLLWTETPASTTCLKSWTSERTRLVASGSCTTELKANTVMM